MAELWTLKQNLDDFKGDELEKLFAVLVLEGGLYPGSIGDGDWVETLPLFVQALLTGVAWARANPEGALQVLAATEEMDSSTRPETVASPGWSARFIEEHYWSARREPIDD